MWNWSPPDVRELPEPHPNRSADVALRDGGGGAPSLVSLRAHRSAVKKLGSRNCPPNFCTPGPKNLASVDWSAHWPESGLDVASRFAPRYRRRLFRHRAQRQE